MHAREFLERYKIAGKKIEMYRQRIEDIETTAPAGQKLDGQPHGTKKSDATASAAAKAADMRITLEAWLTEQERIQQEIVKVLGAVKDVNRFQVLKMRYLEEAPADSWQSIANVLDKTVRHVQRIHGWALLEVQNIINSEYPAEV